MRGCLDPQRGSPSQAVRIAWIMSARNEAAQQQVTEREGGGRSLRRQPRASKRKLEAQDSYEEDTATDDSDLDIDEIRASGAALHLPTSDTVRAILPSGTSGDIKPTRGEELYSIRSDPRVKNSSDEP